jgi:crotonobetainyl-CoA:carnitine CoA-transferase CaiB-like acyl-CoA transferase
MRAPDRGATPNPLVGVYKTKDSRHIQLVFLEGDRYWAPFCSLVGREDLAADPRYADLGTRRQHSAECVADLDTLFAERTFEEWKALLSQLDAPWAPVQAVTELVDDPQVVANGYVGDVALEDGTTYRLPNVPVQFDGEPATQTRAPEHGEHTEAILSEIGYDWDAIIAMKDAGAIL